MLSINCILSNLVYKKYLVEQYSIPDCKSEKLLKCATSYQWLYNNALSCASDLQLKELSIFNRSNFNCSIPKPCLDSVINCSNLQTADSDYAPITSSSIIVNVI